MNTKHPFETVEASADVMKLAEMILSDCGQSTVISDRLQRRVAGRIQQHMDSAAQKLQGQVDALLAAMNVIALGELPDGKYANISTMAYAEEAYKAAQRAPIKDSLTTDRQAEPVAYLKTAAGVMQLSFEGNPVVAVGADIEVQADTVQPLYAQPPAQLVACEFFAYDPECGFETFKTEAEAKKYAQDSIDSYREEASEGWPELVNNVCWGVVLGTTREVALPDNYDGGNGLADYMKPVDYVLTTAQTPAVAVPSAVIGGIHLDMMCAGLHSDKAMADELWRVLQHHLTAAPQAAVPTGWIDPNDKSQKQYLPHIGEPVLFCHDGVTYYGVHTGGSFETVNGFAVKFFKTWDCLWMYPPAAGKKGGA